jgi:putative YphP/YqiW family bacilliredoxin
MISGFPAAIQRFLAISGEMISSFAGVDADAVNMARKFMLPYPPSSPCIALFKDGKLQHMIERHHIEGRTADMIAAHLNGMFEEFC